MTPEKKTKEQSGYLTQTTALMQPSEAQSLFNSAAKKKHSALEDLEVHSQA